MQALYKGYLHSKGFKTVCGQSEKPKLFRQTKPGLPQARWVAPFLKLRLPLLYTFLQYMQYIQYIRKNS